MFLFSCSYIVLSHQTKFEAITSLRFDFLTCNCWLCIGEVVFKLSFGVSMSKYRDWLSISSCIWWSDSVPPSIPKRPGKQALILMNPKQWRFDIDGREHYKILTGDYSCGGVEAGWCEGRTLLCSLLTSKTGWSRRVSNSLHPHRLIIFS